MGNNPIIFIDPDGMQTDGPLFSEEEQYHDSPDGYWVDRMLDNVDYALNTVGEFVDNTISGLIHQGMTSEESKVMSDNIASGVSFGIKLYHNTMMNPWTSRALVAGGFIYPPLFIAATHVSLYQTSVQTYNVLSSENISRKSLFKLGCQATGTFVGSRFPVTGQFIQDMQNIPETNSNRNNGAMGMEAMKNVPLSDDVKRDIILFKGP